MQRQRLKTLLWCLCISYTCVANASTPSDNWLDFTLFSDKEVHMINKHIPDKIVVDGYKFDNYQIPTPPGQIRSLAYNVNNFYITSGEASNVGQILPGDRAGDSKNSNKGQMSINIQADRKGSDSVVTSLFGKPRGSLLNSNNTTFGHYPDELNFGLLGALQFEVYGEGTNNDLTGSYTCNQTMIGQGRAGASNNWWFGGYNSRWFGDISILFINKDTEAVVSLCDRTSVRYNNDNVPLEHTIKMPVIFVRGNLVLPAFSTSVNQVKVLPGFNEFCGKDQKQNLFIPLIADILGKALSNEYNKLEKALCADGGDISEITNEMASIIAREFNLGPKEEAILARELDKALTNDLCKNWDLNKVSQVVAQTLAEVIAGAYCD